MHKIIITGGCGFIGSHLSEYIYKTYKKSKIIIIDKITYAANKKNISDIINNKRVKFVKDDICNFKKLLNHTKNADVLIHVAAESHVDNSYNLNDNFIMTNVLGTKNVVEVCKINKIKKIIHVSTDEIYGEIHKSSYREDSKFNPSNPYSGSKAAAEMIINGYIHSYNLPIIIVRANNIFGYRQHPEKLIAGCCWSFLKKKKFPIHGSGLQKRSFLYIKDFCSAIVKILRKGKLKEIYNIGSPFEYRNIDVVKLIAKINNLDYQKYSHHVKDRPFNDFRYSINYNKMKKLKWKPKYSLEDKIIEINNWYKKNINNYKKR